MRSCGESLVIAIDEKPKAGLRLARLRNIERDPRVSLLADRYDEDWTQLAWVRVEGNAEILERGGADPAALAALRDRYPQYRDMDLEPRPLDPHHARACRLLALDRAGMNAALHRARIFPIISRGTATTPTLVRLPGSPR